MVDEFFREIDLLNLEDFLLPLPVDFSKSCELTIPLYSEFNPTICVGDPKNPPDKFNVKRFFNFDGVLFIGKVDPEVDDRCLREFLREENDDRFDIEFLLLLVVS